MKEEIYTCDGCGKQKGETNHWYVLLRGTEFRQLLGIGPFDLVMKQAALDKESALHLCGEECLLKMVARNLPK